MIAPETRPASGLPRFPVDTVGFSRVGRANLVPSLEAFFALRPENNYVCVSNVHTTVECRKDARLRAIQNGSFLTIADGQPVIYYGRMAGVGGIERIMGPDIMTAVFAAFMLQDEPIIKSMGFALAIAVVFDAFVVRMALIPAVLYLLGDRAWWLPRWLDRLLPEVDVEGEKLERPYLRDANFDDALDDLEPEASRS